MTGQVPKPVVQERYQRLLALQEEISWAANTALVGSEVEVLVAVGEGRKDRETERMSGRARDGRLVHFAPDGRSGSPVASTTASTVASTVRPGDIVTTTVTYAAPHHLVADAGISTHRRTRAGDRAEQVSGAGSGAGVLIGMPTLRPA